MRLQELKLKVSGEVINEDNFGTEGVNSSLEDKKSILPSSFDIKENRRSHFLDHLTKDKDLKVKSFTGGDGYETQSNNTRRGSLDVNQIQVEEEILMPDNDYL